MKPLEPADRIVAAQAAALAGLAWPGRPRWPLPAAGTGLGLAAAGAGAVLATVGGAGHGRLLTPRVEPPPDAELLVDGAYRFSRHPIYAGLLLAAAGVAILRRRPEPLASWVALVAVLVVKTGREEERLIARFGEPYRAYRAATPRFLGRPR